MLCGPRISTIDSKPSQRSKVCILVALVVFSSSLFSQLRQSVLALQLTAADSLQRSGDIREARALYDKILRRNPNTIRPMLDTFIVGKAERVAPLIGRGKTFMTEGWWRKGMEDFDAALEIDPNNLEAHYNAGLCNFELGIPFTKGEPLAFRDKAKAHFEYIISKDSLYEDVFNRYALAFFQEGNFDKAFQLGQLQIKLKPEGKNSYTGLFHMYRWYLAEESESTVRDYLSSQPKDVARYHLGELARRKDRLDEAEKIFREILWKSSLEIPSQPIQLSLARVLFKKKMDVEAEKLFWQAVEGATNVGELRFVYEDVKYIMSPYEVELFQKIDTNLIEQKTFYRVFWDSRNPNMSASLNERMGEHYRRLAYAEENYECFIYRKVDKPGYYYSSQNLGTALRPSNGTSFGVKDQKSFDFIDEPVVTNYVTYALNREYDDRGYIFVRDGEPTSVQRTIAASGIPKGQDVEMAKQRLRETDDNFRYLPPNLTWLYGQSDQRDKLIFEFKQISSFYNEWRLGFPILDSTIIADRVTLDPEYGNLLRAWDPAVGSWDIAKLAFARENVVKSFRSDAKIGLATEKHSRGEFLETMDVAAALTTFRNTDNKTLVDITYGFPLDFLTKTFGDSTRTARIALAIQMRNSEGLLIRSVADTIKIALSHDLTGAYAEYARVTVPPDSYRIALQLQPIGIKSRGSWNANVRIREYSGPNFSMSDVQFLLPAQGHNTLNVEGIRVMPSPFERFNTNQVLRTYVQVYNLSHDRGGKTNCTLEYIFKKTQVDESQGILSEFLDLFKNKKKTSLTVRFDKQDTESMITQYVPFALEQLEPGEYNLTVRITDQQTNDTVERSRSIEIFKLAE